MQTLLSCIMTAIALQHPKVLLFPNVYPRDSSAPGSDLAQAPPPAPALTEEGTQIHNPDPTCWTLRWIFGGQGLRREERTAEIKA